MSGHTPGPWFRDCTTVFALSEDGVNRFSASVQGGWVVTGRQRTAVEELEATARLFEAAPELLAAAKLCLLNLQRDLESEKACGKPFMGDDEHEAIRVLSTAIAKATQP